MIGDDTHPFGQYRWFIRMENRCLRSEAQPKRIGERLMIKIKRPQNGAEAFKGDEAVNVDMHRSSVEVDMSEKSRTKKNERNAKAHRVALIGIFGYLCLIQAAISFRQPYDLKLPSTIIKELRINCLGSPQTQAQAT